MFCKVHPKTQMTAYRLQSSKPSSMVGRCRYVVSRALKDNNNEKEHAKEVVKKAMDESLQNVFYMCDYDSESYKDCIAAWDEYWELEHAYFTKWEEWANDQKDPLETFCNKYPWTTECKVYDV